MSLVLRALKRSTSRSRTQCSCQVHFTRSSFYFASASQVGFCDGGDALQESAKIIPLMHPIVNLVKLFRQSDGSGLARHPLRNLFTGTEATSSSVSYAIIYQTLSIHHRRREWPGKVASFPRPSHRRRTAKPRNINTRWLTFEPQETIFAQQDGDQNGLR